jgi:hypothetical protein
MEHWPQAAEQPAAVNTVSPRSLSRIVSHTPAEPLSPRLNAASAFDSREMQSSPVASGEAGHSIVSQSVQPKAVEVRGIELDEPRRSAASLPIEHERKTSFIEAKPSLVLSEITAEKPIARGPEVQAHGIARAGKNTAKPGASAALVDRRQLPPDAPIETRAGAEIPNRSPAAVPIRPPDSMRAPEKDTKGASRVESAGRQQISSGEMRRVLPAVALPSVENRLSTLFPESQLHTTMDGRPRLREARLRAGGRSSAAEPTIEVTIGRIEVRGPAAAEPRRATAKPSHGSSLEEYLRRRSRGSGE